MTKIASVSILPQRTTFDNLRHYNNCDDDLPPSVIKLLQNLTPRRIRTALCAYAIPSKITNPSNFVSAAETEIEKPGTYGLAKSETHRLIKRITATLQEVDRC